MSNSLLSLCGRPTPETLRPSKAVYNTCLLVRIILGLVTARLCASRVRPDQISRQPQAGERSSAVTKSFKTPGCARTLSHPHSSREPGAAAGRTKPAKSLARRPSKMWVSLKQRRSNPGPSAAAAAAAPAAARVCAGCCQSAAAASGPAPQTLCAPSGAAGSSASLPGEPPSGLRPARGSAAPCLEPSLLAGPVLLSSLTCGDVRISMPGALPVRLCAGVDGASIRGTPLSPPERSVQRRRHGGCHEVSYSLSDTISPAAHGLRARTGGFVW